MTLREFGRVVWFSRWLVLLVTLIVTAAMYMYATHREPVYSATAEVEFQSSDVLSSSGIRLDTDPNALTSESLRTAAATSIPAGVVPLRVAGVYATGSAQLDVTARAATPAGAIAVANAYARAYVADLGTQFKQGMATLQSRRDELGTWLNKNQPKESTAEQATLTIAGAQYASSMTQYQALLMQIANANVLPTVADIRRPATTAELTTPSTATLVLVAAFLGLFLGLGAAVIRHSLDTKVRSASTLHRAGVGVLATIPGVGGAARSTALGGKLPVAERTATPFTQSMRELRTTLQATLPAGGVIVVTSIDTAGSCSFLAANLAASFALSDRSVIVVSGDLRQPRLDRYVPPAPGAVLEGDPGTFATGVPNLRVVPPLRTNLDPADYLAKDVVRDLLARLRRSADVVVLDSPPALAAADAAILGAYADGVVLTVHQSTTHVGAVEEAAARLEAAHAPLLGVVVAIERSRRKGNQAVYAFDGETEDEPVAARATSAGSDASEPTDRDEALVHSGVQRGDDGADGHGGQEPATQASLDVDMPSPRYGVTGESEHLAGRPVPAQWP